MPFTVDGQWVPQKPEEKQPSGRPVKVRTERRGQTVVTVVLNLRLEPEALRELASFLKKRLGGGGTVKNGVIEVQGDKQEQVQQLLREKGIKAQ
jgi:translation initiation factor 1